MTRVSVSPTSEIIVWHGESCSLFYVRDLDGHLKSFRRRDVAERFIAQRDRAEERRTKAALVRGACA